MLRWKPIPYHTNPFVLEGLAHETNPSAQSCWKSILIIGWTCVGSYMYRYVGFAVFSHLQVGKVYGLYLWNCSSYRLLTCVKRVSRLTNVVGIKSRHTNPTRELECVSPNLRLKYQRPERPVQPLSKWQFWILQHSVTCYVFSLIVGPSARVIMGCSTVIPVKYS